MTPKEEQNEANPPDTPQPSSRSSTTYAPITGSQQHEESTPSNARPKYGSIASHSAAPQARRNEQGTQRQRLNRRASDAPANASAAQNEPQSPQMTALSPQTTTRPKKPALLSRASTRRLLPHRGQEFSTEDDASEVEEVQGSLSPHNSSFPPLSRQGSTVRRRPTQAVPTLPRVESQDEDGLESTPQDQPEDQAQEDDLDSGEEGAEEEPIDDEDAVSEAESFTLRDKQLAINQTHPFGMRIWKPALYKKDRSVEKTAEEDIHSSPSAIVSNWLWIANSTWTLLFGWWLAFAALFASVICFLFSIEPSAREYSKVLWGLAGYLFYPFGKFVKLETDENYADEDEGEGRSFSEYERWQRGDLEYGRLMFGPSMTHSGSIVGRRRESIDSATEHDSLLGRTTRAESSDPNESRTKRRLFGRGQWTLGRVIFFVFFYFLIAPLMLIGSSICWFMVFWIPMGRVTLILFNHLRRHPLALTFYADATYHRESIRPSAILLCTYRAVGLKYWKFTIDGTNIFLINLNALVLFVVFDFFILDRTLGIHNWLTNPALLFPLALLSVIPLAYFIGQAVASISAQSSMGMGAAVNAFFSTIVEVYLYCIALNEGKGQLVEGSVIGSIFAGILLLPGISMCFGAIKRKTQRFNVKSAGVTSTMLLFATIAAFGPTLFYKIYGSHELICRTCDPNGGGVSRDCRQCYFRQVPAINDEFFTDAVRPYSWFAAVLLFLSYIIGLLFTLRTHAAVIWSTDADEKKPLVAPTAEVSPLDTRHSSMANGQVSPMPVNNPFIHRGTIRESPLYKRILGQSLRQAGLTDGDSDREEPMAAQRSPQPGHVDQPLNQTEERGRLPHMVPPKRTNVENESGTVHHIPVVPGLSEEDNINLVRQVAEMAATAATVAARDVTRLPRRNTSNYHGHQHSQDKGKHSKPPTIHEPQMHHSYHADAGAEHADREPGGHDAPNWSRSKSYVILLTATIAYALVAEVLVNTVDIVLESVDIDEKFLGITLFALVPNTTEFLNAISFAMNGNIALSMEIGSAYALQVCLLQIPALVLFSAVHGRYIDPGDLVDHTFNLIFPQWDMVTVILCVFLLSYIYAEGKSNYFKGSVLVLTYLVVLMGFYLSSYTTMDALGVDPGDTLAIMGSYAFEGKFGGGSGAGGGSRARKIQSGRGREL